MQFFSWLIFLIVIGIAIFAIQNLDPLTLKMKFVIWRFETSLIYTILGSIGAGILMTLIFWVPRAIMASIRVKELKRKIENLEAISHQPTIGQEGNKPKEL